MAERFFYSVKQVAELLGIREHGVLSLIRSGELRGLDVSLQPGGRPDGEFCRTPWTASLVAGHTKHPRHAGANPRPT